MTYVYFYISSECNFAKILKKFVMAKIIRTTEPIVGFGLSMGNPHSIAQVQSVGKRVIVCECIVTEKTFSLHHNEKHIPFISGHHLLLQEKHVPGGESIFKIKDANEKPIWKNGETYVPLFEESIIVTLKEKKEEFAQIWKRSRRIAGLFNNEIYLLTVSNSVTPHYPRLDSSVEVYRPIFLSTSGWHTRVLIGSLSLLPGS